MSNLVYASIALGVANHLYWKRYERDDTKLMSVATALLPQPAILVALAQKSLGLTPLVTSYAAFFLSLGTSIVLYRISPFHPLAGIPGPFLARVTKLWTFYTTTTGELARAMKKLHDEYGPVVRTGPNEISIIDGDAVNAVYGTNGIPKGKFYTIRTEPRSPTNLLFTTGQTHQRRRARWNRALGVESLKNYDDIVERQTEELLDVLAQESKDRKAVDLTRKFQHFTFDVMSDVSFGRRFGVTKSDDSAGYVKFILDFSESVNILAWVPWAFHAAGIIPHITKVKMQLLGFARDLASSRAQAGATQKDIWYHLMDEEDKETQKPLVPEVVADGILAIIAGTDTSASAMSSTIWFVLQNSEIYTTLQREIDEDFAQNPDVRGELPYLSACISEALRLHPPNATGGPRQVPREEPGRVILGMYLPGGTQVIVPPYSVHRNPDNFSLPTQYLPERWLPSSKSKFENHRSETFIPFSYGAASCVGRGLAHKEMLSLLSKLFYNYDMKFAEDLDVPNWENTIKDYFISPMGPLKIVLEARH
ncbi:hypothetical protein GYMLUDRAFT_46640 [Collybiopsis luxurians FD-317 M1]|uniref:Cytochrome P450 n=1 Tax=Collybiopsis luxurians FD-317 M1 TaxID=944289 RepID=A0A0D0B1Q0_9AGAR|nr:hypothetical protein GYMLUDRAFT_46640 [Collybiopsis luxurians FD-317 M1]